jgi:leader peptidase (prepilin peptidase)/N-methyltransferase
MAVDAELTAVASTERRLAVPPGVVAVVAIGLGAGALAKFDLSGRAFVAAFFCVILTVLAAIDLETRLIPNRIVIPAAGIVLVGDIVVEPSRAREWLIAAALAGLVAFAIAVVTRGGLGFGDVKLCVLLGAGLGWAVFGGIVIGALAGALGAAILFARHGWAARSLTLPYGPFLAFGGVVALFLA